MRGDGCHARRWRCHRRRAEDRLKIRRPLCRRRERHALRARDRARRRNAKGPAFCRDRAVGVAPHRAASPELDRRRAPPRFRDGECRHRSLECRPRRRQRARLAAAARPRRVGARLAAAARRAHEEAPRGNRQRQLRPAMAARHGRHRARRRRIAVGHRLARPARSVWPQARSHRDRFCRRDRRRRLARAGPGRRGDADCHRARPFLDRAGSSRERDRAPARARPLPMSDTRPVLALSGGIGGAKLALGLYRVLPPDTLTVVANTGDDFEHLGLSVSPDLDTLLYTLSGNDNPELGWGRRGETWTFMAALEALGGETWFRLGDGDLATHVERTRRLNAGERLSAVMDDFRRRLGIAPRLLPVSDDPVRTRLLTPEGWLDFQDYFVRLRCAPVISELEFAGAERTRPHPQVLAALADPALRAVVI